MGWKKMILGEQMPDKDDPKYRQRYEKEVNAGRKFAIVTGIDKLAATVQQFAIKHKKAFFLIILGFLAIQSGLMIYRIYLISSKDETMQTATERQEEAVRERRNKVSEIINAMHCMPPNNIDNNISNKKDNGHTKKD